MSLTHQPFDSLLKHIPVDTFILMCEYLSYNNILSILLTCKSLYSLSNDSQLWITLVQQRPLLVYIHAPLNHLLHSEKLSQLEQANDNDNDSDNYVKHDELKYDDMKSKHHSFSHFTASSSPWFDSLSAKQQVMYYHGVYASITLQSKHSSFSMTLNHLAVDHLVHHTDNHDDTDNINNDAGEDDNSLYEPFYRLVNSLSSLSFSSPIYKIVVTGDRGSGVSTLVDMYRDRIIRPDPPTDSELRLRHATATIGIWNTTEKATEKIQLQLIDKRCTVYGSTFSTAMLSSQDVGMIRCVNLSDPTSLQRCAKHIKLLSRYLPSHRFTSLPMILVGTKSDLGGEQGISYTEAVKFASSFSLSYFQANHHDLQSVVTPFNHLILQIASLRAKAYMDEQISRSKSEQYLMKWLHGSSASSSSSPAHQTSQ